MDEVTARMQVPHDLPRNVDLVLVADSKLALKRALRKKHGDDVIGKLATLQRLVERVKNGDAPRGMDVADRVALFQVLIEHRIRKAEPSKNSLRRI